MPQAMGREQEAGRLGSPTYRGFGAGRGRPEAPQRTAPLSVRLRTPPSQYRTIKAAVLMVVGTVAALPAARRAARTDPLSALRSE